MGVMTNELILARIKGVLEDLRPNIQMDGGDIEFVGYVDGVVSLKLQGACASCPLSVYTIKLGIEERLREFVPEVIEVIAV